MELNVSNTEKLVRLFKIHPLRTLLICVLSLLLVAVAAYVNGYFGEKGKTHAISPSSQPAPSPLQRHGIEPSSNSVGPPVKRGNNSNSNEDSKSRTNSSNGNEIIQQPKGDQSPAVVVGPGGKSVITYGSPTKKGEE